MAHKYRLLERPSSEKLSDVVTERLADGWDLWGNPFAVEVEYFGQAKEVRYFQAMVRFDASGHAVAGKVETALGEPAGYSVQVPETPSMDNFSNLGAAIGSGWRLQEEG